MSDYTSANAPDTPSLTYETVLQMKASLLPLAYYVASELFPADGNVIVIDRRKCDEQYPTAHALMFGGLECDYLVYCHPAALPEVMRQAEGRLRLEPLPRIESE